MSEINKIVAGIGDAILEATKRSKAELKAYIDRELGTYKFSGTQIRQNTIPGLALANGDVPLIKIGGLQAEIANIAVAEIASATIDFAQINNVLIKTAQIDDAAITTAKIGNAAITSAKIGNAAIENTHIGNAAIKTANIDVGSITSALIQDGAVGSVQIGDGSITDAKIVELTANKITAGQLSVERLVITGGEHSIVYTVNEANSTPQLSAETIDGGSLTERSITADRIVAKSITADEIAAETITGNEILANSIVAGNIAAGAIDASKIKAGSIETSHLSPHFGNQIVISDNPAIGDLAKSIKDEVDRAVAVEGEIYDFTDKAKGFFVFDLEKAELTIGEIGSPFKQVSSPTKLSFKQGGVEVAYISNNKLYISIAHVMDVLTIGEKAVALGGEGFTDMWTSNGGFRGVWRAS